MTNNLMPLPSGPDLFWIAVELAAMVALFAGLPMEARNVREGQPPTKWWHTVLMRRTAKRTATRKEFVATYRRVLTRRSWTGLALGVGILVITVVFIMPPLVTSGPPTSPRMAVAVSTAASAAM